MIHKITRNLAYLTIATAWTPVCIDIQMRFQQSVQFYMVGAVWLCCYGCHFLCFAYIRYVDMKKYPNHWLSAAAILSIFLWAYLMSKKG